MNKKEHASHYLAFLDISEKFHWDQFHLMPDDAWYHYTLEYLNIILVICSGVFLVTVQTAIILLHY